jgi:hypothetical protein
MVPLRRGMHWLMCALGLNLAISSVVIVATISVSWNGRAADIAD